LTFAPHECQSSQSAPRIAPVNIPSSNFDAANAPRNPLYHPHPRSARIVSMHPQNFSIHLTAPDVVGSERPEKGLSGPKRYI
jgi:hypothetical protein